MFYLELSYYLDSIRSLTLSQLRLPSPDPSVDYLPSSLRDQNGTTAIPVQSAPEFLPLSQTMTKTQSIAKIGV